MMPRLVVTKRNPMILRKSSILLVSSRLSESIPFCAADLFPMRRTGVGFAVSSLQRSWYVLSHGCLHIACGPPQCSKKPYTVDCSHQNQTRSTIVLWWMTDGNGTPCRPRSSLRWSAAMASSATLWSRRNTCSGPPYGSLSPTPKSSDIINFAPRIYASPALICSG